MNKKELEILLSQIKSFENPSVKLEQYPTEASIAADCLWNVFNDNNLKDKILADLGSGPGIFGLGALILGAKKVYFVELDKKAMKLAKENHKKVENLIGKKLKAEFCNMDIKEFSNKVDVVIQNPPFGVKETHMDKLFLIKAMEIARKIYSFHKLSTQDFIKKFAKENNYHIIKTYKYQFPLKQKFWFHTSRIKYIDVGCWFLKRKA
ncbi:MAG: METTL5 family protein [archaeon]